MLKCWWTQQCKKKNKKKGNYDCGDTIINKIHYIMLEKYDLLHCFCVFTMNGTTEKENIVNLFHCV